MAMKILTSRIFWGLLLILGGVLFLLQNLNVFEGGALFWMIVLAFLGVLFIAVFVSNRLNWWALIPGIILLAVAILIGLTTYVEGFNENLGGAIVLGGIGLSFLLVYLVNHAHWWAIIPAGVLFTIAAVAGLSENIPEAEIGGIFMIGLGLTFALVALLPNPHGRMSWAWIPASILALIGIFIDLASGALLVYVWSIALFVAGGYMIFRAIRSH
jgi:hypothetical protein